MHRLTFLRSLLGSPALLTLPPLVFEPQQCLRFETLRFYRLEPRFTGQPAAHVVPLPLALNSASVTIN